MVPMDQCWVNGCHRVCTGTHEKGSRRIVTLFFVNMNNFEACSHNLWTLGREGGRVLEPLEREGGHVDPHKPIWAHPDA